MPVHLHENALAGVFHWLNDGVNSVLKAVALHDVVKSERDRVEDVVVEEKEEVARRRSRSLAEPSRRFSSLLLPSLPVEVELESAEAGIAPLPPSSRAASRAVSSVVAPSRAASGASSRRVSIDEPESLSTKRLGLDMLPAAPLSLDGHENDTKRSILHPRRILQRIVSSPSLKDYHSKLVEITQHPDFEKHFEEEERAILHSKLHTARRVIDEKSDRLNLVLTVLGGIYGVYVGVISSMLLIFTPTMCPPTATNPVKHGCSVSEVLDGGFAVFVLVINVVTLLHILLTELVIFRREKWMNNRLSVDDALPPSNRACDRRLARPV